MQRQRQFAKKGSVALAQLASRISATMKFGADASEDPFLKGFITDSIEQGLAAPAKFKGWCTDKDRFRRSAPSPSPPS